ncbi:hypothetical protein RUND412_004765 [Rhizina undulata]
MVTTANSPARPKILVIGGAYAGLATVVNIFNLLDGNKQKEGPIPIDNIIPPKIQPEVVLLDERDGFLHSMGTPLAHVVSGHTSKMWIPFSDAKILKNRPNFASIRGTASSIDMTNKVAFYNPTVAGEPTKLEKKINYDYLVVATGTKRDWPILPSALEKKGWISESENYIQKLKEAGRVAVIGGGGVGVEFAAEIKAAYPEKTVTLIHSRNKLMSAEKLPDEFKDETLNVIEKSGVEVLLEKRVIKEETGEAGTSKLVLSDGTKVVADLVIYSSAGRKLATDFLPKQVIHADGGINVQPSMQFSASRPNAATHFAVGDVVKWTGIRRVGSALIMAQTVATNILKMITEAENAETSNTTQSTPNLVQLPDFPHHMTLAIGNEAVGYAPHIGLVSGREMMAQAYGESLGLKTITEYFDFDTNENAGL